MMSTVIVVDRLGFLDKGRDDFHVGAFGAQAIYGEDDVVCLEVIAVVELDALAQIKPPDGSVRRSPSFSASAPTSLHLVVANDKAFVDVALETKRQRLEQTVWVHASVRRPGIAHRNVSAFAVAMRLPGPSCHPPAVVLSADLILLICFFPLFAYPVVFVAFWYLSFVLLMPSPLRLVFLVSFTCKRLSVIPDSKSIRLPGKNRLHQAASRSSLKIITVAHHQRDVPAHRAATRAISLSGFPFNDNQICLGAGGISCAQFSLPRVREFRRWSCVADLMAP